MVHVSAAAAHLGEGVFRQKLAPADRSFSSFLSTGSSRGFPVAPSLKRRGVHPTIRLVALGC